MSVQELQKLISPRFTEELLIEMVEKRSRFTNVVLKNIELGAASKKGDSYLSTICRFCITAEGFKDGEKKSLMVPVIVKFFPKNKARVKTFRTADFFENEFIFFEKVWPAYKKFQENEGITDFDNVPTVLSAHCDGQNDYIAMYDLSFENFITAERGNGLDYDHTVSFLQILAQFHALGLTFKEKNPEAFEAAANSLKETYYAEKLRGWYSNFQKKLFIVVRDAVEKELPQYLTKFDKLIAGDIYGAMIRSSGNRGPLAVVTHGDVWVPNFLLKYDDGDSKPSKIVIIDFQLTRYSSVAMDLCLFLFCCPDPNILETKWDDLIFQYHHALNQNLQKYGAKRLVTIEALNNEIMEHRVSAVGMLIEAFTMSQVDDEDVADLDAIQGEEAVPLENVWMVKPFKQQEKRKKVATMIKFAADRNFF